MKYLTTFLIFSGLVVFLLAPLFAYQKPAVPNYDIERALDRAVFLKEATCADNGGYKICAKWTEFGDGNFYGEVMTIQKNDPTTKTP